MQPPHQHSRIDLAGLKDQLMKKLGPEGSKQYFDYLRRFLSLKVSKAEFNKLCLRILGRENIALHNQLIRSILKNASTAKSPPPINQKDKVAADVFHENGSHGNRTQTSCSTALSNGGDVLPTGKLKFGHQLSENKSSGSKVMLENGNIDLPDIERLVQHHQESARSIQKNDEAFVSHPSKMLAVRRLPDGSAPPHSKGQTEVTVRNNSIQDSAPGPSQISRLEVFSHGALLDSVTLRERMERIALTHGLEGASLDCANLLNLGLDSYLKGLIGSSIELAGSRSNHYTDTKLTYGVRPGDQLQTQGNNHLVPISLQDFRVAIERNSRQLGQDWPLLLERIITRSFEE